MDNLSLYILDLKLYCKKEKKTVVEYCQKWLYIYMQGCF